MPPFTDGFDDLGRQPGDAHEAASARAAFTQLGCDRLDRQVGCGKHRVAYSLRLGDQADQRLVAFDRLTIVGREDQLHILAVSDANRGSCKDERLILGLRIEPEDAPQRCAVDMEDDLLVLDRGGLFVRYCAQHAARGSAFFRRIRAHPERMSDEQAEELFQQQLRAQPGATLTVDLPAQKVIDTKGRSFAFEIDSFSKDCLVAGLSQIDLTLRHRGAIDAFEKRYRETVTWI